MSNILMCAGTLQAPRDSGVAGLAALLLIASLAGLLAPASWAAGTVRNPYTYPTPPGVDRAAVYFELHNNGTEPLVLNGATAEGVAEVQIHRHQHSAGMMGMRRQLQVEVGAGETLVFAPGVYHLMLLNLSSPLSEGGEVHLQLQFAGDEALSFTAPVLEMGGQPRGVRHGSMQH